VLGFILNKKCAFKFFVVDIGGLLRLSKWIAVVEVV